MALTGLKSVLKEAERKNCAVGAFEFWSLDSARAVAEAAKEMGVPVILQAGPLECAYAGIRNLAWIAKQAVCETGVDAVLHLDHGDSVELARQAIDAGFTSVMIDSSLLPLEENIAVTREVVELAHRNGVDVEGEIGILGGNETGKEIGESGLTDPEEARQYVERTGVDAVAVAIGTAHGVYVREPKLRIDLLEEIARNVKVPIVLHGGSGVPEDQIRESVRHGVRKVNICTELLIAMGTAFSREQGREGFRYSVPSLFGPAREAGKQLALKKLRVLSPGRENAG